MENELIKWGGYVGMAITTLMYFFFPARRKEIDGATKTLVETLQNSVLALQQNDKIKDDQITELKRNQEHNIKEIKEAREEIKNIKQDRDTIKAILEARDKNTAEFQRQCLETNKITSEMYKTLSKLVEGITKNNQMTEEFVKTMREHFLNVEKAAIK